MIRAEEHDTDRRGRVIFLEVFQELNWLANRVEEDYGIDYNVQAFSGKHPTGAWFQVQLKSSQALTYSTDETFISYSLDIEHLVHYAIELKQPLFIVLVDVASKSVFWTCPQLNSGPIRAAHTEGAQSLTLRIPTANSLPDSAAKMIEALSHAYLLLAARELGTSSNSIFQTALESRVLDEQLLVGLQAKQDHVRLSRIAEAYEAQRFDDVLQRISNLTDDPDATLAAKFHAEYQLNTLNFHQTLFAGAQAIDIANVHFEYAERLRLLAKREHYWIRLGATIIHAAARIDKAVQIDAADDMALRVHAASAINPLAVLGLLAKRAASSREIVRLYNRSLKLINRALQLPEALRLCTLITRVPLSISAYLLALRQASDEETNREFVKSCLSVLEAVIAALASVDDQRGIVTAIHAAGLLNALNRLGHL